MVLVASLSILAIFILCLLIIPIIYTFLPYPKDRHLEHLNKRWIGGFVELDGAYGKTQKYNHLRYRSSTDYCKYDWNESN